jgi:hypothetical protein
MDRQTLFVAPLQEWKKSPSPAISSRKLTMLLEKEGKEKESRQEQKYQNRIKSHLLTMLTKRKQKKRRK